MSTLSPNMFLLIPTVGETAGPDYASDVNTSLTLIDQHDHTPGSGVQITPAAININTALPFGGNFATDVAGVTLTVQGSAPAVNTIYQSGDDLYFVDALGNDIQITANGAVAGTPGSIANLVAPASASYVAAASTFVFESNTSIAGNIDVGSVRLRNLSPNSTYAITLQSPAALSSNYDIVLPPLPASTKVLSLTSSGVMATGVNGSVIAADIATNAVIGSKIIAGAITTVKIEDGNVTFAKLATDAQATFQYTETSTTTTIDVPDNTYALALYATGGGGGGGGGGSAGPGGGTTGGGGAGGGGAALGQAYVTCVPGETITITIGSGGAGGAGGSSPSNGSDGSNGGNTTVAIPSHGTVTFRGGKGGGGGTTNGAGGSRNVLNNGAICGSGGTGNSTLSSSNNATAGQDTWASAGGAAGTGGTSVGAGGGGGGASAAGGAGGAGANGQSGNGATGSAGAGTGSGGGGGSGGRNGGDGGTGGAGKDGYVVIAWVGGDL